MPPLATPPAAVEGLDPDLNAAATLERGVGLVQVLLAAGFWSTSGIFITLVVENSGITPVGLAFWRDLCTFACLVIFIGLFRPQLLRVRWQDLPWLAAMGTLSIAAFHTAWNAAIVINGVSVANVFQANAPVLVTVIAWALWREALSGIKLTAVALAFAGTIMIARPGEFGPVAVTWQGAAVGILAAISYSSLSLFGKKFSARYSPWTILVYAFGFGTLVLSPFQGASLVPQSISGQGLLFFGGLVLVTTLAGFGLYTSGLRRLPASVASITSTAELPFAALLAHFLLQERPDSWQVLGGSMVLAGVILDSLPARRRPAESDHARPANAPTVPTAGTKPDS